MLTTIIQALFYFLPAYIANACPVIFSRFGWWKFIAEPVDGGRKIGGAFVFGSTKTWRGVFTGVLGALLIILAQYLLGEYFTESRWFFLFEYEFPSILILGLLFGFGEGFGDLIKSFIKRRLKIDSSKPCLILDRSSFLGAVVLSLLYFSPPVEHILAILIISPLIPIVANLVAYKIGWKKVWW